MGRSVVLKDMKGRPQGYLREAETGVFCRAALDEPAKLLIAFDDGTQETCALDSGRNEQMLAIRGRCFRSGCVFRDSEPILMTNDAARQMLQVWLARVCREKKADVEDKNLQADEKVENCKMPAESKENSIQPNVFPARRWPPPPCWDTALYIRGRWEEKTPSV